MAVSQKILKFLENNKAKYDLIEHKIVFTAHDKAATLKVPEKTVGKTLVARLDKDFAIILIPANKNLDKGKLKDIINKQRKKSGQKAVKSIDFASEVWMKNNLKGVKVGAVAPFGNLWKLSTFADNGLLKNPKIIINAGDWNKSLNINSVSYKKIVPDLVTGNFSKSRK